MSSSILQSDAAVIDRLVRVDTGLAAETGSRRPTPPSTNARCRSASRWMRSTTARVATLGGDLLGALPAAHGGAWAAASAGPVERFRYYRALRALLEELGRERPVALVLDDLHWADEASIEWLLHVLRRPPGRAHLLAFALRNAGPAPRLLDAARSAPGFERLALEPLAQEASLGLLAGMGDRAWRERVAREAGGNPFFLGELGRLAGRGDEALPDTVLAAVASEVAALAPAARTLIDGAAVAGDPFDPELAAAAAGVAPDAGALDGLGAADLVRANASGREFAFRHPLIRRAVYDAAPPAWRLSAHERAASELERRGATLGVRAYHVARCARPGDAAAIALLREAAATAAGTAPTVAAHWYQAALRLVPGSDRARRAELLLPLARALVSAGRLDDSRAVLVEALETDSGARRLELQIACARVETQLSRHADARRRLLAVRATAPRESRARLAFELAAGAFHQGRAAELREWADPALQAATEADAPLLRAGAAALAALGALWDGELDRATACLQSATTSLGALDDAALATHLAVAMYVGVAQNLCEHLTDAAATSARALEISRRTGEGQLRVTLLGLRAIVALQLVDLDIAADNSETAEDVARLQGMPHVLHFALWIRALVHDQRGERAEAERCAREGGPLTGALEPSKLTRTAACDFAALAADHDAHRAVREMPAAAGPQLEHADPTWQSWLLLRLVRATLATGALHDAERLVERAESHTARLKLPAGAARAACARAELLLARGQAGEAAALALTAASAAERVSAPLDALEARLLAGRALAAAGDAPAAEAVLQRVAGDAGHSGAERVRGAAARQLRRLGTRVSARNRPTDHGELTERERHVAELVAQGHSNKHIAATLFLSEKTVANTLTRVYAKLGVRSRSQLAATHRA